MHDPFNRNIHSAVIAFMLVWMILVILGIAVAAHFILKYW